MRPDELKSWIWKDVDQVSGLSTCAGTGSTLEGIGQASALGAVNGALRQGTTGKGTGVWVASLCVEPLPCKALRLDNPSVLHLSFCQTHILGILLRGWRAPMELQPVATAPDASWTMPNAFCQLLAVLISLQP